MKLERRWYEGPVPWHLVPLEGLFRALSALRRGAYRRGVLRPVTLPVPVVVVGNLTVGGTGKTPLTLWLAAHLLEAGYKPGIVTRGYGGNARDWPRDVTPDSDPVEVGDEPVLMASRELCPVVAGPDRVAAARRLIECHGCNLVISDDGLQHYRLARDVEIVVIDGERRFGNGHCLPAGPLREPPGRLAEVDLVVVNGTPREGEFGMHLEQQAARPLAGGEARPLADFSAAPVHAVAAIGNPRRFFDQLRRAGLEVIEHPFPDHHRFTPRELRFEPPRPVLMTEKDMVKCRRFAPPESWFVPVEARLDEGFAERVVALLKHTGPAKK